MKNLLRVVASATLSLMLVTGVGLTLTGCSADTLSGPSYEASASGNGTSGGTDGGGSEHNTYKTNGDGTSGGTDGGGSEHNILD